MTSENRRLNIAFMHTLILEDKRTSWTITNGYIAQALQKHCGDITYLDPVHLKELLVGKIFNRATQLLLNKSFMYYHSFYIAKRFAKVMGQRLEQRSFDVIVAPSCATEIGFLETDIPIVLIEDATFALLHEYYAQYRRLLKRSVYETDTLEGLALEKASLALYPSEWAARSALEYYRAGEQKVHVVPFGGNIDAAPALEVVERKKKSEQCRLFFIGVEWERKGGEIAFETLLKLEEMGVPAELIVCGCIPPAQFAHARMKVIPYLSKKDEKQRKELDKLFETSDFLLLPTRGDTYGMVFCEASAFGLPAIATNTGGVSGAVKEGENGFLLPLEARGGEYAELIARIYRDGRRYADLVRSSRAAFDNRLNWDAWGISVTKLITELVGETSSKDGVPVETIDSV